MEETKRKTLANCKLSEFTRQAMIVRGIVNDYYTSIEFPKILEKYKERDVKDTSLFKEIINDVVNKAWTQFPEKYVKVIAAEAFLTEEEAENLEPSEAYEIFLECAMSRRVLDFFINVELTAQSGTESILPVLIFLRQGISETNTSESESQNSTNDISENSTAGDMSESV
jgi:hypothetical protein